MNGRQVFWLALEVTVLVVAVALVLGVALGQPVLLSFVETGSMSPTLEQGDGFVAVPTSLSGDIEAGDVVVYRSREGNARLTTHRVVGRTDDGFVTKGDANPFTDQQSGEPPVPRDRIVATALRVNGRVVAIPYVGAVVGASRDLLVAVSSTLGIGSDPSRVALFLLVTTGAALALDHALAAGKRERDRSRSVNRDAGYDADALLLAGVAVVVAVATVSMALPSGASGIAYDSVPPERAVEGGLPGGESGNLTVRVSNRALVPAVVFLDAPGERASVARRTVVLEPQTATEVNVTVTAPGDPGRYEVRVAQHRYVALLPVAALRSLHETHPWAAIGAVDALLAVALGSVGRLLLGRGRLRMRGGRRRPAGVTGARILRRLYR